MIRVCGHRVLVKMEKLEEADPVYKKMSQLGFARADNEDTARKEASLDRGTVVQVGAEAFKAFYLSTNSTLEGFVPWCKEGDFIAFAKYSGKLVEDPVTFDKYMVINDEDVVAVLEGYINA